MAFITIPSSWLEVGKSIKKGLLERIKDNQDDHESRIDNLEEKNAKQEIFCFEVIGYINHYTASELVGIGTYRAPLDINISEVKLVLLNNTNGGTSSSSGVLSIDLEKSSDNGITWNSILSQKPEIPDGVNSTGSESSLVTFIPDGEVIAEGELVRVNVISKKDTQGSFLVSAYGEV